MVIDHVGFPVLARMRALNILTLLVVTHSTIFLVNL